MTTELEKTFFDTFGIKPKVFDGCTIMRCVNQHPSNCTKEECPFYFKDKIRYPQITDRILLKLICVLSNRMLFAFLPCNYKEIKDYILNSCIKYLECIDEYQIQALFEEE